MANKTWGFCVLPSEPIEKKSLKDILNEERNSRSSQASQSQTVLNPVASTTPLEPIISLGHITEQKPEGWIITPQGESEVVDAQTASDELLACTLQREEETKLLQAEEKQKNSGIQKHDITPEMQKYQVTPPTERDEMLAYMLQIEEEDKLRRSMVHKRQFKPEMQKLKEKSISASELVKPNSRDWEKIDNNELLPEGWNNPMMRHDREVNGKMNSIKLGRYDKMGDLPHDGVINNQVYNQLRNKLDKMGAVKTTDGWLSRTRHYGLG